MKLPKRSGGSNLILRGPMSITIVLAHPGRVRAELPPGMLWSYIALEFIYYEGNGH